MCGHDFVVYNILKFVMSVLITSSFNFVSLLTHFYHLELSVNELHLRDKTTLCTYKHTCIVCVRE